jgi:hypothetical protein
VGANCAGTRTVYWKAWPGLRGYRRILNLPRNWFRARLIGRRCCALKASSAHAETGTGMAIEWTTVIEGGIPLLGGLYATALGYGLVHTSRAMPNRQTQKTIRLFRWLGPLVVLFGIFTAWQTHAHLNHPPAEQLAQGIRSRMTFPVRVDAITQATGVEGRGDTLIYDYSIAASLQQLGGEGTSAARTRRTGAQSYLRCARFPETAAAWLHAGKALHGSGVR